MDTQQSNTPIVPYKRPKVASRAVVIADNVADKVITVGGISVIIAVLGILVFLVAETLPLFQGGEVTADHDYALKFPAGKILTTTMDEYKTMTFSVFEGGKSLLFHALTGTVLSNPEIHFDGKRITATASGVEGEHLAFGFEDGTVRLAEAHFETEIIRGSDLPPNLTHLNDRDSTDGAVVYSRIPGQQYRKISFELDLQDAIQVSEDAQPVTALDYRVSGEAERQLKAFVVVDSEGNIALNKARSKLNMMTGKTTITIEKTDLPPLPRGVSDSIASLLLTTSADAVMVAETNGTVYRYNTRDDKNPLLAETVRVLPEDAELTALNFLLGEKSIVVGGSDGTLQIFFIIGKDGTPDGQALTRGRIFASRKSPITRLTQSARGKSFAAALQDGTIQVIHGTSQKTLAKFSVDAPLQSLLLSPRFNGLMALQEDGQIHFWEFDVPHPETTFKTLFQKVWYEGYEQPTYTWQSTGATEDFESKFSLIPLIFGTIKAAFYSLLFAIPIAILGAIYTSEFLHLRVRSVVKPTMEMMASLPSVVLGFVAALVLAPIVETWVAAVLLAFISIPVALMLSAFLWQLLPLHLANRWRGIPKFSLMVFVVLLTTWVTYQVGILFEFLFFGGDFKGWLNGDFGGPEPFLFLILLPISLTITGIVFARLFGHRFSQMMAYMTPFRAAVLDMGKWVAMVAASIILSYLLAKIFAFFGVDTRGAFIGTYVQRNTLIVGFAMGFAVIPIIYTIAEDALNAVPAHLRAASLGCGATQWQTAIYVVLPTAMSGVFSAIMIGMGRAVGETMIVVMAAGNTPLMDWNVFNGLRALSATIAVELPEAVKDGTLYRILFLSGLVLFAMTFVINTIAEVVRIRFRKRAAQL